MNEPQLQLPTALHVCESKGRGRGVFALRSVQPGELLERAPVLVVPRQQVAPLRGTLLDDYWFLWDEQHIACALGWASLYNHACPANASFTCDPASRTITFVAVRGIRAGEEVTNNYQGAPDDPTPVWFPTV